MYTKEISIGRIAAAVANGRHIWRQKFRDYRLVYLQNTAWAVGIIYLSSFGSPLSHYLTIIVTLPLNLTVTFTLSQRLTITITGKSSEPLN